MNPFNKLVLHPINLRLRTSLVTVLFMLLVKLVFGQSVLKYVPSTADVVVTFNLQNLDKKVNLEQLRQYDFYQAMLKEMSDSPKFEDNPKIQAFFEKMLTSPASVGFDTKEPVVVFMEKVGFDTYTTIISKLGNKAVYESAIKELMGEYFKPFEMQADGMSTWRQGENLLAWNDEVVLEVVHQKGYDPNQNYYDYGYEEEVAPNEEEGWVDSSSEEEIATEDGMQDETDESFTIQFISEEGDTTILSGDDLDFTDTAGLRVMLEGIKKQQGSVEDETTSEPSEIFDTPDFSFAYQEAPDTAAFNWVQKLLNRQFLQPITRNERFALAKGRTNDVHFWVDYAFLTESMTDMQKAGMGGMGPGNSMNQFMSAMGGFMDIFYSDTYLSLGLNFEDGQMALRSQLFFNEDMKRFYSRALDAKFNKKFLRYVKGGDEMFGYFYLNYNIKNTIDESKALLYKIFEATPQYGEAAADAIKILGIFIDEEAIGNLLKGDLMFAISGIQTVETKTVTYDYDADFNFTTRDTTMMKQVPIFTALASYGNGKDIQKFIDLGLHSKVLTHEGRYYRLDVPGMDGMSFFLAKQDGLLIFTNNAYLMKQNLDKGFAKKLRLPKNHKKRLCESASVVYWNIPNTIRAVAGDEANSNIGLMGYLNNIGKEFYSMEATSSKKVTNSVDSEMFLKMTTKDTNALQQFFNFINDLYLETIGGAKI
ncbi:MAG: DUF4836 family protein [Bacteroidetes bacterium]|nr:DUF4836 family protein [Bacteroidota bacterium]